MVWFKVDDRFHGSEPVKRIPREHRNAAIGLWTLAGTWSAQFLKDGFVPTHIVDDLGGTEALVEVLVEVGLWRRVKDGVRFADWEKWQRTRERVESERKAVADRVAAHRAKKAGTSGDGHADVTRYADDVTPPQTRPDPTRPSSNEEKPATSRGTRLPDPFELDDIMRGYARSKAPAIDVEREHEKFVNYWTAKTGSAAVKKDWAATWRNWMLSAQGYAERDGWKPQASGPSSADENALRDRWLSERGITLDEYRDHYEEPGWLDALEAKVAKR